MPSSVQNLVAELRRTEREFERQLEGVRSAIAVLAGVGVRRGRPAGSGNKRGPGRPKGSGRKKRTMSAKARAAISRAQKARWAKQRAAERKK